MPRIAVLLLVAAALAGPALGTLESFSPFARMRVWWLRKRDAYCYNYLKLSGEWSKEFEDIDGRKSNYTLSDVRNSCYRVGVDTCSMLYPPSRIQELYERDPLFLEQADAATRPTLQEFRVTFLRSCAALLPQFIPEVSFVNGKAKAYLDTSSTLGFDPHKALLALGGWAGAKDAFKGNGDLVAAGSGYGDAWRTSHRIIDWARTFPVGFPALEGEGAIEQPTLVELRHAGIDSEFVQMTEPDNPRHRSKILHLLLRPELGMMAQELAYKSIGMYRLQLVKTLIAWVKEYIDVRLRPPITDEDKTAKQRLLERKHSQQLKMQGSLSNLEGSLEMCPSLQKSKINTEAVGSTDLTSDYDVSTMNLCSAELAALFNVAYEAVMGATLPDGTQRVDGILDIIADMAAGERHQMDDVGVSDVAALFGGGEDELEGDNGDDNVVAAAATTEEGQSDQMVLQQSAGRVLTPAPFPIPITTGTLLDTNVYPEMFLNNYHFLPRIIPLTNTLSYSCKGLGPVMFQFFADQLAWSLSKVYRFAVPFLAHPPPGLSMDRESFVRGMVPGSQDYVHYTGDVSEQSAHEAAVCKRAALRTRRVTGPLAQEEVAVRGQLLATAANDLFDRAQGCNVLRTSLLARKLQQVGLIPGERALDQATEADLEAALEEARSALADLDLEWGDVELWALQGVSNRAAAFASRVPDLSAGWPGGQAASPAFHETEDPDIVRSSLLTKTNLRAIAASTAPEAYYTLGAAKAVVPVIQAGLMGIPNPRKGGTPEAQPALELHVGELLPALVEQVADSVKEWAHVMHEAHNAGASADVTAAHLVLASAKYFARIGEMFALLDSLDLSTLRVARDQKEGYFKQESTTVEGWEVRDTSGGYNVLAYVLSAVVDRTTVPTRRTGIPSMQANEGGDPSAKRFQAIGDDFAQGDSLRADGLLHDLFHHSEELVHVAKGRGTHAGSTKEEKLAWVRDKFSSVAGDGKTVGDLVQGVQSLTRLATATGLSLLADHGNCFMGSGAGASWDTAKCSPSLDHRCQFDTSSLQSAAEDFSALAHAMATEDDRVVSDFKQWLRTTLKELPLVGPLGQCERATKQALEQVGVVVVCGSERADGEVISSLGSLLGDTIADMADMELSDGTGEMLALEQHRQADEVSAAAADDEEVSATTVDGEASAAAAVDGDEVFAAAADDEVSAAAAVDGRAPGAAEDDQQ